MNKDTLQKIDLRRNKIGQRGERALSGAQLRKASVLVIYSDEHVAQEGATDVAEAESAAAADGMDVIPVRCLAMCGWYGC